MADEMNKPTMPIVRKHPGLCPILVDEHNYIIKLNAVLSTTLQLSRNFVSYNTTNAFSTFDREIPSEILSAQMRMVTRLSTVAPKYSP